MSDNHGPPHDDDNLPAPISPFYPLSQPLTPAQGAMIAQLEAMGPRLAVYRYEDRQRDTAEFLVVEVAEPLGPPFGGVVTMEAPIRARFEANQAGMEDAVLLASAREMQRTLHEEAGKLQQLLDCPQVRAATETAGLQLALGQIRRRLWEASELPDAVQIRAVEKGR